MKYGRYEIVREVGRGAMGVVYQAHDPDIDRMVALKVLREDRVSSQDLVNRFVKEAKAIGRLSHPNIVTVYDVGQDHNTIYIAMEFLEGTPLNEIIKGGPLPHSDLTALSVQMAEAIDYAHQKGIVHRDIKPTNIIVTAAGQVKITDFGIAHIEDPSATQQTQAGEILGTPVYMSPEQVMGKTVDGRSDLYALGVILYELATGRRPFKGDNLATIFRAITQDPPTNPADFVPSLSPALGALILKSLSKNPQDRFQTGKAVAEALKASLKGEETIVGVPERTEKRSKGPFAILLSVLLVLSAAGALSYVLLRGEKSPQGTPATSTGGLSETASAPEVAAKGTLKVESFPEGAQVYLNGAFKGKSPLTEELPLGKHEVRLSLPDYYEWEAQIQLREEGQTPLFVRLIPMERQ